MMPTEVQNRYEGESIDTSVNFDRMMKGTLDMFMLAQSYKRVWS